MDTHCRPEESDSLPLSGGSKVVRRQSDRLLFSAFTVPLDQSSSAENGRQINSKRRGGPYKKRVTFLEGAAEAEAEIRHGSYKKRTAPPDPEGVVKRRGPYKKQRVTVPEGARKRRGPCKKRVTPPEYANADNYHESCKKRTTPLEGVAKRRGRPCKKRTTPLEGDAKRRGRPCKKQVTVPDGARKRRGPYKKRVTFQGATDSEIKVNVKNESSNLNNEMEVDCFEDCIAEEIRSDDEFFEDDSELEPEVEEILASFDGEGNPKNSENDRGSPKLPAEFGIPLRQRRFRKAYGTLPITTYELFSKVGGMTVSLGKRDAEKRICNRVKNCNSASAQNSAPNSELVPVNQNNDVSRILHNELQIWIRKFFNQLHLSTISSFFDDLKKVFIVIWESKWFQTLETRIEGFINLFVSSLRNIKNQFLEAELRAISLKHTLHDYDNKLLARIVEKNTIIDYWLLHKHCLITKQPEFDESSIWGLKSLRNTLMSPYFKDWYSRVAAPSIFDKTQTSNLQLMITSMKKKWTVKDVAELKTCIRNTILEKKLEEAKEASVVMQSVFNSANPEVDGGGDILEEINSVRSKSWEETKKEFRIGRKSKKKQNIPNMKDGNTNVNSLPHGGYGDLPFSLTSCNNSEEVKIWLKQETSRISALKWEQVFDQDLTTNNIDWNVVSAELMSRTKKLRVADDCRNCFEFAANPLFENKRNWNEREKTILKAKSATDAEWVTTISNYLPKPRPEFVVFYKWRKLSSDRSKKMTWTPRQDELLLQNIKTGTWDKTAVEVGDFLATKKQVQERFKKSINPILRFGKFTRVEDSLMLLTLEKLKCHLEREKHFGIMTAYLPWRYESAWRDRAENLFAEYIVPWTLEEDKMLLKLATVMNRDWSRIAKKFKSFKTRKGCLTRHKILEKRLGAGITLETYHHSYAMIRYNIQEYRHLKEISSLLKEIMTENVTTYPGFFARDRPPTEDELQNLILSFDREVMASTIRMIDAYLCKRDEFWSDWRQKNGMGQGHRRTHDRRTFHEENTQSIASALHIRDVQLIPMEKLNFKLTKREAEIYKFYAQFCSTKALKREKLRPYIPLAESLVALPDVRRIYCSPAALT